MSKNLYITLVWWLPWLYKSSFFRVDWIDHLNLSSLFWKTVFRPDFFLNEIKCNNNSFDKEELLYIAKNSQKVYKNLIDLKDKDIWIEKIVFSFVLIYKLTNLLSNNFLSIKFFDQFKIKEKQFFENLNNNIIFRFLEEIEKCNHIKNYDNIIFRIDTLEQLYQIKMIDNVFFQNNLKEKKIFFFIWDIIEFESKSYFLKFIKKYDFTKQYDKVFFTRQELFNFFNVIPNSKKSKEIANVCLLWKTRSAKFLFSWECDWWKCYFCNFWYNEAKSKSIWDKKNIINNFLNDIERNRYDYMLIRDPSITMDQMLLLADEVIKRGMKVKFQVKTRFSEKYTKSNCKKLKNAWIEFLGVWLESASTRVNNFMNKYDKDYDISNFDEMLNNCNEAWLKLHHYVIFWFPSETKEEANLTYKYLEKNIARQDLSFYSYTVWTFWVAKWTYVYNNPEEFWIKTNKEKLDILDYDFEDSNLNWYSKQDYYHILRELDFLQFFDFSNYKNLSKEFWYFVEKSWIFHFQKFEYKNNPYLEFSRKNSNINLINLFDYDYKIAENIQIIKTDKLLAKNWLSWYELEIDESVEKFLSNYNSKISFIKNCELLLYNYDKKYKNLLYWLIKMYFFIKK